ncbi:MAG: L-seryl-tRNA(Sec) selenium transferase [Chloroflexota bacterium]|nr:L-seryl-tRNA(Sec) selenium transferase [Chloroflexota bacterium]
MTQAYRNLPSVDKVLALPELKELIDSLPQETVTSLVRHELASARAAIKGGGVAPEAAALAASVVEHAHDLWLPRPQQVINATGVVIHTNLGRAPLSGDALHAIHRVAEGYSDLEYDLAVGIRGSRHSHVEELLQQLTGAEAALVVNNNAAAMLLTLSALAADREVAVSRGEAVEIGGGFRIPDVLRQSGSRLVEVGTTNRTYLHDFESTINSETAAFLSVHASNFKVVGFTNAPELVDLVTLAHRHELLMLHDLGSGCFLDTTDYGMSHEPTPQESIAAGTDVVLFSGDKLLGGPQAGIAVGKAEVIQRMARHPLARTVRIDKLSLAALTATLVHYLKGQAVEKVPVWAMIATTNEELQERAIIWARTIGSRGSAIQGESTVGGGSLPGETLPTWLLSLDVEGLPGGATGLSRRLRNGTPSIVARVQDEKLMLDPRTVSLDEEPQLLQAVIAALG